jgi:D-glycero-D-manno-heptose 1,7-bisphosphate phosphatase
MRLLPGVVEACHRLRDLGYLLVVITNQPDIARGTQTREEVERMHDVLRRRLPLDEIVVCPHDDADGCACRKPKPGMILDAAKRHGLDLAASFSVGDRWRDVEAARRAEVRAIFVDRGYGERRPTDADAVVANLPDAVGFIESHRVQGRTTS